NYKSPYDTNPTIATFTHHPISNQTSPNGAAPNTQHTSLDPTTTTRRRLISPPNICTHSRTPT
ncbi:hypothetical protein AAHH78_40095, partial [Burkholderia pseudomallei]